RALDEARPVGAELEAHRDARDDTERKRQREDLDPKVVGVLPRFVARRREAHAEIQEHPGEADRDRREQDVEADVQRELKPRQRRGIEIEHSCARASSGLATLYCGLDSISVSSNELVSR